MAVLAEDLEFHGMRTAYATHNLHSFPAKFPPQLPRKFILSLTEPGDTVLDPMAGSGTTLLEARLAGRHAIGFDIDPLALRQPVAWQDGGSWNGSLSDTFHLFGGDDLGRDVFSRVIWGARVSLFVGVVAVALGFLIGGVIGLTAGYFRGRFEKVVMSVMDIMLAFPALILALAIVTFLSEPGSQDASISTITITLTILSIPALARITRASTLTFAQREFVQAARTLGAKNGRIIVREILPNVIPPMVSFSLIAVAIVIVAEGALSFLGLSVSAPTATWGNMINEGRTALEIAPHIALVPCAVMFLTLLSLNYVGDQLRRRFDVKEVRL